MIKLYKPDLSQWGPLTTEIYDDPDLDLLAEVKTFYDTMLIPDLVCNPGQGPDRPHESWILSEGKALVVTRDEAGSMMGCWVLKDHGIYYPCINIMKGAVGALPILRDLAYASFQREGEEMWASTNNPLIQAWVNRATDTPEEGRPNDMPLPKFRNGRVEWKSE